MQNEARKLQLAIAFVFWGLGGWCLIAPASVIELTVRPEFQSDHPLTLFSVGAFGAQAMLAGLFAALSRFTRWTFAAYGAALLPFFVFNYWVYFVTPMFNELILLDFAGNIIMLGLCVRGWIVAPRA